MLEDLQYLENTKPLVTAASVGISRKRWISTTREEIDSDEAIKVMAENRFDILPIVDLENEKEVVRSYYKTIKKGDYSKADIHDIKGTDLMRQERNIRTVIRRMALEGRDFFFLIHNHVISGMISSANLNSRKVQAFVFHLIIELETALAEYLQEMVDNSTIIRWVEQNAESKKGKAKGMIKAFKTNRSKGLETSIVEHFFLRDLFDAIYNLDKPISSALNKILPKDESIFETQREELNTLRNLASHPVRSMINEDDTLQKLNSRLELLDEMLFKLLNNHLSHKIR
jgi:hypothetical protein